MYDKEPWHLTIVLLEGLRFMRPEKAWRPIVTIEVDKLHVHETTLGVDGQNINQKEEFKFHDASRLSKVDINVWHRSQSKKKKRRLLVASASHCLGELLKKQDMESKLEIRLQCRTASSRGRPQNGAVLRLKLRPPPTIEPPSPPPQAQVPHLEAWECDVSDDESADSDDSVSVATDTLSLDDPPSANPIAAPQQQEQNHLRRRRVRGYTIDSDDDEVYSSDASGIYSPPPSTRPLLDDSVTCVEDSEYNSTTALVIHASPKDTIGFSESGELLLASDLPLPLYTEKVMLPLSRGERVLASFTMYGELSAARREDEFEPVFRRLQHEWTFIGGLLVALSAVNTAVFSISSDSLFTVSPHARGAIAASSVASGLGIACDAWFLLRYNWADLGTFISRARDLYASYFFFALSARVPALCMFISALSLMCFLALVAFEAWPQGVLAVSFLVGVVMSMQFLVYGVHWCVKGVMRVIVSLRHGMGGGRGEAGGV